MIESAKATLTLCCVSFGLLFLIIGIMNRSLIESLISLGVLGISCIVYYYFYIQIPENRLRSLEK